MLGVIALVYILLCVRIRVYLAASWINGQGSALFCAGALGMYLRRDFVLSVKGFSFRARPRYGREKETQAPKRSRRIRGWLLEVLRSRGAERITLQLRMGLGDACDTAVAVGAVRALASTVFAAAGKKGRCELHIAPDFAQTCLCAHLQGIFSWPLGDIMLAALKQARRKRKEGLNW